MAKPGRAFFIIYELEQRWECAAADIIEWATMGHFRLVTSVPMLQTSEGAHAGIMELAPEDLLTSFRRTGATSDRCRVIRMRPLGKTDEADWLTVDPREPYEIRLQDILVNRADVDRFEDECGLATQPTQRYASNSLYDWDGMWAFVAQRLFEDGKPRVLSELIGETQEWFLRRTDGKSAPDESTLRKRLSPLWKQIQAE